MEKPKEFKPKNTEKLEKYLLEAILIMLDLSTFLLIEGKLSKFPLLFWTRR